MDAACAWTVYYSKSSAYAMKALVRLEANRNAEGCGRAFLTGVSISVFNELFL